MNFGKYAGSLTACALLFFSSSLHAQAVIDFLPTGVGNWNSGANWADIGFGNNVPESQFDEQARINSGGAAQVLDTPPSIGGIQIRNGAVEVTASGNLVSVAGPGGDADGVVEIDAGGTVSVAGAMSAPRIQSSGTIRTVGAGSALAIAGDAVIGGTYIARLTSGSHGPMKVAGNADLSGSFVANFNGATPTIGSTWNVIDAGSVSGDFGSVTVTGATLGLGQTGALRRTAGGTHGNLVQFALEQKLVLQVNRETGVATILNPSSSPVSFNIDGYAIESQVGSIGPGGWNSLDAQGSDGNVWRAAGSGGESNGIAELIPTTSVSLAASQSRSIGSIYEPNFLAFGQETEDYTFTYHTSDGTTHNGVVIYEGDKKFNNLVLTIDPTTGNATLQNESPFAVSFDAYTISSASGSLRTTWSSLDDQDAIGGAWLEANPSSGRVSEVMSACCTTLAENEGFSLGALYNTAGSQDVEFQFLLAGTTTVFQGAVVFGELPDVIEPGAFKADFNGDGKVDNADLADPTLGFEARFGDDLDGSDLLQWQREYGAGAGLAAAAAGVPEPTAGLLATVAAAALAGRWRRRHRPA